MPLFVLHRTLTSGRGSRVAEIAVTKRVVRLVLDSGNLLRLGEFMFRHGYWRTGDAPEGR